MRVIFPWLFSFFGLFCTVGQIMVMNRPTPEKVRTFSDRATSFLVAPPPPPPPPKTTPPPKIQKTQAPPPPPIPMMSTGLTGLSFGMDALQRDFSMSGADVIKEQEGVVMTSETVDIPPRPLQRTPPKYPRQAQKKGIEGYVVLSLLIDNHGQVQDIMVVESYPAETFESAALDAIRSWAFRPGEYKGQAVPVRVTQTLKFELG